MDWELKSVQWKHCLAWSRSDLVRVAAVQTIVDNGRAMDTSFFNIRYTLNNLIVNQGCCQGHEDEIFYNMAIVTVCFYSN